MSNDTLNSYLAPQTSMSPILPPHTTAQNPACIFNETCTPVDLFINKCIEKRCLLEKIPGLTGKVTECFYVEMAATQYKRMKNKNGYDECRSLCSL